MNSIISFYLANPKDQPFNRHVYSTEKCLSCDIESPEGTLCLYASATFSKDFSFYTLTCSGPDPSFTKIIDYKNPEETTLNVETNEKLRKAVFEEFNVPRPIIFWVPVGDKFQAPVMMICKNMKTPRLL